MLTPDYPEPIPRDVTLLDLNESMVDLLATSVLLIDAKGTLLRINPAAETLLEASVSRAVGEPLSQLIVSTSDWDSLLDQAIRGGFPLVRRSLLLQLRSGQQLTVDVTVTPINKDRRDYVLLEMSAVDRLQAISEGENLLESQASLRQIIKGLAHEVKNPLGGIRGAAQLLARELPDQSLAEYTDIIMGEADRLRALVDKMLGPREKLDLKPTNIHVVLERVRQLLEAETQGQVTLVRDYDPSLPDFTADPDQLTQVFLNITRNAWQAAGEGSQIILKTRARRQFTLGGKRHRLVCAVEITDNGPGVPPEILPRLFLPMVSSRAKGTGLGLSIAQIIATRHGGLIQCQSQPGCTTFTMLLPMRT